MKALFLAICLFPLLLSAQTAPDFTITDSDGVEHSLYEDYLDEGQTVLIKIFFTTCPPCRSIASSVEIFYQQWGAGEFDVEFFELSNKTFDTDPLVNGYKAEFGITFPSAGSDGGSLEALAPYLNGDFGPFFGTPTFVVISPDGTVQWDVNGPDLWIALDTALYSTGALKPGDDPIDTTGMGMDSTDIDTMGMDDDTVVVIPPAPVEIGGKVYSYANASKGIFDANVMLKTTQGVEIARDTTDSLGNYAFSLDSALVADSVLHVEVFKDDDPKNGITAIDLLLIQKHLLGITPLDATEKLFASDANLNQAISATDLLFLKRLLLDLEDDFSDGKSWIFFHADITFGAPGEQPPPLNTGPVVLSEVIDGLKSPDFRGIKRGDVNNSVE